MLRPRRLSSVMLEGWPKLSVSARHHMGVETTKEKFGLEVSADTTGLCKFNQSMEIDLRSILRTHTLFQLDPIC
jgi:hypothetical protein